MHIKDEQKIENGVSWKITFNKELITIIAQSLETGRRKMCEYECVWNFRDGYDENDILEAYRIVDEFVQELGND